MAPLSIPPTEALSSRGRRQTQRSSDAIGAWHRLGARMLDEDVNEGMRLILAPALGAQHIACEHCGRSHHHRGDG